MSWDLLRNLLGINSDNTGGDDVTAKDAIVKYVETYGTSRTKDIIDGLTDMGWSENTISQELANLNGGPIYSPRRGVYAVNTDYEPEPEQPRETVEDVIQRYIDSNHAMDGRDIKEISELTGYSRDYIRQAAGRMVRSGELERDYYPPQESHSNRWSNYYRNRSPSSRDNSNDDNDDNDDNDNEGSGKDPGCWDLV